MTAAGGRYCGEEHENDDACLCRVCIIGWAGTIVVME